jgi:hypothetical protein
MRMTAWFDIIGLAPNAKQDEEGLNQARQTCKSNILNKSVFIIILKILFNLFNSVGFSSTRNSKWYS